MPLSIAQTTGHCHTARTAITVKGKDIEGAGAAAEVAHDTDRDEDHSSHLSELKTTEFHDEKPSSNLPAGIPNIPSTNSTTNYLKDPGEPPNAPDGTSRGDVQETAESGGQWQRTTREVNRNDGTALPAPNLADRTSEMATGDSPVLLSRTRPIKTVKHQRMSMRYIPLPIGRANANAQHSNGHPKPRIHLPRQHRQPLEGERHIRATNGDAHSSSRHSMPQKLAASLNESDTLVTVSTESEKPHSGEIPRVRLAGVRWHADDENGPRSGADASNGHMNGSHGQADESKDSAEASNTSNNAITATMSDSESAGTYLGARDTRRAIDGTNGLGGQTEMSEGQTDMSRAQADAPNVSNTAETAGISRNDSAGMYLGLGDAKHTIDEMDGLGGHADRSNGQTDTPTVKTHAITPTDEVGNIRTCPNNSRTPNLPPGSARERAEYPNGLGNRADTTSGCTGVQSAANDALKPRNAPNIVSIPQTKPKPPDLPGDGARLTLNGPNGWGSHTDTSSAHTNVQSVGNDALTPRNEPQTVKTRRNGQKWPNSPGEGARWAPDKPNSFYSHTDASNARTGVQSIAHETETPANAPERVKTARNGSKTNNSPVETASQRSDEPNGCRDRTDASSIRTDAHSVETHARTAANAPERIRTRQTDSIKRQKRQPNAKSRNGSPMERTQRAATRHPVETAQQGLWTHPTTC